MATFVTSDPHYNHAGIIGIQPRPFKDVHEMNAHMIEAWNSAVRKNDTVFVLGDFAFVNKYGMPVDELFAALNGYKHLVIGNHDEHNPAIVKLPWERVEFYRKYKGGDKANRRRAVMSHYPMETWDGAGRGTIMLHGHSHGNMKRVIPHRFDVGVDVEGYVPRDIDYYFDKAAEQEFDPQDHHGDL